MSLRLYERPTPRSLMARNALAIVGSLRPYIPEATYEGRLSIVGAIGACSARLIAGELPVGATVSVDNTASEIVVAWPAYSSGAVGIPNGDFEDGDFGWEKGPGWARTNDNAVTGAWCMKFIDHGGDSVLANSYRASITPGETVNASCQVRQGASSSGNAGACVRLDFYSADNTLLTSREGTMVAQGENNEAKLSNVSAVAPPNSAFVSIACRGFRKRQNREVWVDSFEWDVAQASVGTNESREWPITLEAKDSIGRTAQWSGVIRPAESLWVATNPSDDGLSGVEELLYSRDFIDWTVVARSPAAAASQTRIGDAGGRAIIFRRSTTIELLDDPLSGGVLEVAGASFGTDTYDLLSYDNGNTLVVQRRTPSTPADWIPRAFVSFNKGATWTEYALPSATSRIVGRLFRMPSGRWVCNGYGNFPAKTIMHYTDAATPTGWVTVTVEDAAGINRNFYAHVQHANGVICAFTNVGDLARTVNGADWVITDGVLGTGDLTPGYAASIAVGDVMLLDGAVGVYARSADAGLTWAMMASPLQNFVGLAYGSGLLVGWDEYGSIVKSTDLGLTWSAPTTLPGNRGAPAIGFIAVPGG